VNPEGKKVHPEAKKVDPQPRKVNPKRKRVDPKEPRAPVVGFAKTAQPTLVSSSLQGAGIKPNCSPASRH
jgi:hypothetical protein